MKNASDDRAGISGRTLYRILLIEDNPLTTKLVRLTLEGEGYEVVCRETGAKGIEALKKNKLDLILQDIRLPDIDGLELIHQLREIPEGSDIPIIAFTGFVSMVDEAKIANSGFSDYLLKPVEPSQLIRVIKNHLVNSQSSHEEPGRKKLVLIVDDDLLQLKFTSLQFKCTGFEVITAINGEEGLEVAKSYRPQIIVSDVLMPKLDGFGFCKAIRADSELSEIPIVLVSANYIEEIDRNLASDIGANGYVYRSLGIQKVIDTVLDCLNNETILKRRESSVNHYECASGADVEQVMHARVLQQLERQVSLNIGSRQRGFVQHAILGQIGAIADSLVSCRSTGLPLNEMLSQCLDGAGLTKGLFYGRGSIHVDGYTLKAYFGFVDENSGIRAGSGCFDLFDQIIESNVPVAIPLKTLGRNEDFSDACKCQSEDLLRRSESESALLVPIQCNNEESVLFIMFSNNHTLLEEDWVAFGRNVAFQFSQALALSDTFIRLFESEQKFNQLVENINEVFFLAESTDLKITYISDEYKKIWRGNQEIDDLFFLVGDVVADDKPKVRNMLSDVKEKGESDCEFRRLSSGSSDRWIRVKCFPIVDEDEHLVRVAGTIEDITERKISENSIHQKNRMYSVISSINYLIVRVSTRQELYQGVCRIIVDKGGFDCAWIGFPDDSNTEIFPEVASGPSKDCELIHYYTVDVCEDHILTLSIKNNHILSINNLSDKSIEVPLNLEMASRGYESLVYVPIWYKSTLVGVGVFYSFSNKSFAEDELKLLNDLSSDVAYAIGFLEAKNKVDYLAYNDLLTGLKNRESLKYKVDSLLRDADQELVSFALVLINVNNFRDINETLGYSNGDKVIFKISKLLKSILWIEDNVYSLGGDEFLLLLTNISNDSEIDLVVNKISDDLKKGFEVESVPLYLEARMGISVYPFDGEDMNTLWRHADLAMLNAKENHVLVRRYCQEDRHFSSDSLSLLSQMSDAIEDNQLVLYWQPKVCLKTRSVIGVEALLRWMHPKKGLLYPDTFIPQVERTGLIHTMTDWVLNEAMRQSYCWKLQGIDLDVAINLSMRNIQDDSFHEKVLIFSKRNKISPKDITLEVTESAVMNDADNALFSLKRLHDAGFNISIDDFGVGESSLSYLKDFPVNNMKVDKSFSMQLANSRNKAILKAAIDLGHNLDFSVTAEGVENREDLFSLVDMGCDVVQGYYFSKPLPADEFKVWLFSDLIF